MKKVKPKYCKVANAHGKYFVADVFVDNCAGTNFAPRHLVESLKLPIRSTTPRRFETVQGYFWADEIVKLNWRGLKRDGVSNFYVLPDASPVIGLIVGVGFIQKYGEDVFKTAKDAEPVYITAITKASVSGHSTHTCQWRDKNEI